MRIRDLTQIIGAAALFATVGCGEVPRLGGTCEQEYEALCDDEKVVLVCTGGSWEQPPYTFCSCDHGEDGVTRASCPVPGFVGIARSGRTRQEAPALRAAAV